LIDRLFDLLGELLHGLPGFRGRRGADTPSAADDPFLREAEQELEEYLRTGRAAGPRADGRGSGGPGHGRQGPGRGDRERAGTRAAPEELRRDFANLGLQPSATIDEARRAHRRLLARYHPDRFARDPEKQRLATRITQILNASFRRIRELRSPAD
jgi:DnaJ like chaperone protein